MAAKFKHPIPIVIEPDKVYCGIYRAWFSGSKIVKFTNFPKVYIGQAGIFKNRKRGHTCALNNQRHFNMHLQRAFNKYGKDNFNIELIEECLESELDDREVHYVALYKSNQSEYGYNLNSGGNRPVMHDEVKERISKAHMGKIVKQSTRDKLRDINLGKKLSEEQKERQRQYMLERSKGLTDEDRMFLSKSASYKRTEETKKKMSLASTGNVPSTETRLKLAAINLQKKRPNSKIGIIDDKIYVDGYLYTQKFGKVFMTPPEREIFLKEKAERIRIGYIKAAKSNTGRVRSDEARLKMSQSQIGRKATPEKLEKMRARTLEYWAKVREQNGGVNVKAFKIKEESAPAKNRRNKKKAT